MLDADDMDGLAASVTELIVAGNPKLASADWTQAPAVVRALALRNEREFERGARLFHLKAFGKEMQLSEIPKSRTPGFGGPAKDVVVFPQHTDSRRVAEELQRRVTMSSGAERD